MSCTAVTFILQAFIFIIYIAHFICRRNFGLTPLAGVFFARSVIICSDGDEEQIRTMERNDGPRKAASLLLGLIYRKKDDYFVHFMQALRDNGYEDIAKEIEPAYMKTCKKMQVSALK